MAGSPNRGDKDQHSGLLMSKVWEERYQEQLTDTDTHTS